MDRSDVMAGWRICQVIIMPESPEAAEVVLAVSQIKIQVKPWRHIPAGRRKAQEHVDVAAATVNDSDFIVD
jgi:hypothetical protein